jgi:hypothetical protein
MLCAAALPRKASGIISRAESRGIVISIETVALSLSKGAYRQGVLRQAQHYGYGLMASRLSDFRHRLQPFAQ